MPSNKSFQHLRTLISHLNDGEFHSGESLGRSLGLTRAAVWKILKTGIHYGLSIDSVVSKGYRLRVPLSLLDQKTIRNQLSANTNKQLTTLSLFDQIDSTHRFLVESSPNDTSGVAVCLAETQTSGTGRYGRTWHSPFAQCIALSLRCRMDKAISELNSLSLAIASAIVKSLQKLGVTEPIKLKWPNDVLINGKKIAGSLVSVKGESHGQCQCIISVGMNVQMQSTDFKINQPWQDLSNFLPKPINRNNIVVCLLEEIMSTLELFKQSGFSPFIDHWLEHDALLNHPIALSHNATIKHGIASGVNEYGHLLVKSSSDNNIAAYEMGEVSLKK